MVPQLTFNLEALIFVPASLAIPADPTTTSALLVYFCTLRTNPTSIRPNGCSAPQTLAYRSNHRAARAAMAEFASYYGEDADSLAAWQAILSTCAFETILETLDECKYVSRHHITPPLSPLHKAHMKQIC